MSIPGASGGAPLTDITGRMAVFGRLFTEHVGMEDVSQVPDSRTLVETVKQRVPRTTTPAEDAPVFEAAAFIGEWMRAWTDATWVAEGPIEPHLQVVDGSRSVVYLVPLVSIIRVASTAGYDGLPTLIEGILRDVLNPPRRAALHDIRVRPDAERPRVAKWVAKHAHVKDACRATLWRRCSACATLIEDEVTLHNTHADWERDAATAAGILARRAFRCACGGTPGEVGRFLLLREKGGETRLADIRVGGTYTRVACWTVEDDEVAPLDATDLSVEAP